MHLPQAEERAEDLTEQVQSKIGELQQARAFLAASHEEAASLKSALRLRDEALAHLQQERAQVSVLVFHVGTVISQSLIEPEV